MFFRNRQDAGRHLTQLLTHFVDKNTVLFAIPNGGVLVGAEIANAFHLPLDVIVTGKMYHSHYANLPIGAVSETEMYRLLTPSSAILDQDWEDNEWTYAKWHVEHGITKYHAGEHKDLVAGHKVILIDDGIEYGTEIEVALREIRKLSPAEITVAVPVAPLAIIKKLRYEADHVVFLAEEDTYPIHKAQFYSDFHKVTTDEVTSALEKARKAELIYT